MSTQKITVQLNLEVPTDGYDYSVDIDGRIERWAELFLSDHTVHSVETAGPTGSGLWVEPRYDVLVFRDTDGGTDTYSFKNGEAWTDYNERTFDNGNSTELSNIRENAYNDLRNPETPEGIKDTLREGYTMEQDSKYVEDDSETCTVCGSDVTQYPTYPDEGQQVGYLDSDWQLGFSGHEHTLEDQDVAEDDADDDEGETTHGLSTEELERIADTQRLLLEELGLLPDDRDAADALNDKMTDAIKYILQHNND